jgi:hypothetical protein
VGLDENLYKELKRKQTIKRWAERIDKLPLWWIFDPRIEETHRIYPRTTRESHRRVVIRHFFSWENLLRLTSSPVFKVGLLSVLITPPLAKLYISLESTLGIDYNFPLQMSLLFFSGLSAIIARTLASVWCPYLIKEIKMHPASATQAQAFHIEERAKAEIQSVLQSLIEVRKITPKDLTYLSHRPAEYKTTALMMERGFKCQHEGLDGYGVWLIERIIHRIAAKTGKKIYIKRIQSDNYHHSKQPAQIWSSNPIRLYLVEIRKEAPYDTKENHNEGNIYVQFREADARRLDGDARHGLVESYISGINELLEEVSTSESKMIVAELQNYSSPIKRIVVACVLGISASLLIPFLWIQASTVTAAAF